MAYGDEIAQQQMMDMDRRSEALAGSTPAEQREIWRKEWELRMKRRLMALDRALTLAPQLGGDHQTIVRAARDFLAFLDE